MAQEEKYKIELTPAQICELLEWHKSHVEKYRKMGVKRNYLKFHENCNLACFLRDAYELIMRKEKQESISEEQNECDPRIFLSENL